jgi:hypothetical protein
MAVNSNNFAADGKFSFCSSKYAGCFYFKRISNYMRAAACALCTRGVFVLCERLLLVLHAAVG